MDWVNILILLKIFVLAFVQSVSFSIVSRSRNRDNMTYHIIAAVGSNTLWFLTMRELIVSEMSFTLIVPYICGTVLGSVFGVKISMKIETWLNAKSDSHIK